MADGRSGVSSIRQRLLEALRIRSEHAASFDETMRAAIATRLIEEYTVLKAQPMPIGRSRERTAGTAREKLRSAICSYSAAAPARSEATLDLVVAWHGTKQTLAF